MTRLHALIIAPDYPPTNRSSSLRAYYLAQAFAAAGMETRVLAETPPASAGGMHRPAGEVAVVRIGASHRAWWLLKALWRVATMPASQQPRVILSTSGPFLAHVVGALARMLAPQALWVADYRDLWSSGHYYRTTPQRGPGARLRRWLERRVLRKAGLVTTVSRGLQVNLAEFHSKEVLVFHNGFEASAAHRPAAPTRRGIQLCHTGSLYADRSPAGVLAALDAARAACPAPVRPVRILFAGPVDATVRALLDARAGDEDIVYLGLLPRADAYRLQQESDYCLLVEDPSASMKGVLTGKVFEYIGMRRRIVAFGISPDSELAELLARTGLLAFCGEDVGRLTAFLASLMRGTPDGERLPDEVCIASFERARLSRALVDELLRRLDPA